MTQNKYRIFTLKIRKILIKNEKELKKDLTKYLFANKEVVLGGDSLKDLVKKELIQQLDKVNDWQTAVRIASKPLLEQGYIEIETLEGMMKASFGDYIIKGIKGEFYPCKSDIFQATYEEVR